MLQITYTIAIIYLISVFHYKGKNPIGLMVFYSLFCPRVIIGNSNINTVYFAALYLFFLESSRGNGKISIGLIGLKKAKQYVLLVIFSYCVYLISWLINSRIDFYSTVQATLGAMKNLLLIITICKCSQKYSIQSTLKTIFNTLSIITILNFAASLLQLTSVEIGKKIVCFRNEPLSISFMQDVVQWGSFSRCFGIMNYPMMLGILSLFCFSYFWYYRKGNGGVRLVLLLLSFACGVFSASKTFWIGMLCLTIVAALLNYRFAKKISETLIFILAVTVLGILISVFYDEIGVILGKYLGANFAWYWGSLKNIGGVFSTRYSLSEATVLSFMPSFIKDYWLMGVGPSSIAGEQAIDSALYAIIHHGGFTVLIPVIIYYVNLIYYGWKTRNALSFIFAFLIFISGVGFQTWLCQDITVWSLSLVFILNGRNGISEVYNLGGKNEKSFGVSV